MVRFVLFIGAMLTLQSCSASKFMEKSANIFEKGLFGALSGMTWATEKVMGKINPERLEGEWKLEAVYEGTYDEFVKATKGNKTLENKKQTICDGQELVWKFDTKNNLRSYKCGDKQEESRKYKYEFDIEEDSGKFENIIYNSDYDYVVVKSINKKGLVLEGYFISDIDTHIKGVAIFTKQ